MTSFASPTPRVSTLDRFLIDLPAWAVWLTGAVVGVGAMVVSATGVADPQVVILVASVVSLAASVSLWSAARMGEALRRLRR